MNLADLLEKQAKKNPHSIAIVDGNNTQSFSQLLEHVEKFANLFSHYGVKPGQKVLFFVKPGLYFPSLVFALFKLGAIPVMMDPGMGRKNLLTSIQQVKPDVLVGVPLTMLGRFLFFKSFASIGLYISVGHSFGLGRNILRALQSRKHSPIHSFQMDDQQLGAILFTSGGTGRPKGVEYTQGILAEQTKMLKAMFQLNEQENDLPCFPLFALFTLSIGMKIIIPKMNPSKPAKVCPKKIVNSIIKHRISFVAGSPAIWDRVGNYCLENNIQLSSVKYMVMFGAPVSIDLHRRLLQIIPHGNTYTPYGATECLPVSCIDGKTVLENTASKTMEGAGTCVGRAVQGVDLKIISISDESLDDIKKAHLLESNEVGEICVQSAVVTKAYYKMPEQTKLAKIKDGQKVWHRMGDVGYLDEKGMLWFCGRKSHRVTDGKKTLFSDTVEIFFDGHPRVKKSALIGVSKGVDTYPAMAILLEPKYLGDWSEIKSELEQIAKNNPLTQSISEFVNCPHFPVDGRHNIKIDRLAISHWATKRMQKESQ